MTNQRLKILQQLASYIDGAKVAHPVRVAIDGVETSGKTTLANELIEPLKAMAGPLYERRLMGFIDHDRKDMLTARIPQKAITLVHSITRR